MAGATTPMPTRRTAFGTAAGSSPPSKLPFFTRRVTLSGGGVCSSRPRQRAVNNSDVKQSAVVAVSRDHARVRACACSPTTHPGSFRCALHRGGPSDGVTSSSRLHRHGVATMRSAMANSLVRIAAADGGDHVRPALEALNRPSSHSLHRRAAFCRRPSRLSAMSTAGSCSPPH